MVVQSSTISSYFIPSFSWFISLTAFGFFSFLFCLLFNFTFYGFLMISCLPISNWALNWCDSESVLNFRGFWILGFGTVLFWGDDDEFVNLSSIYLFGYFFVKFIICFEVSFFSFLLQYHLKGQLNDLCYFFYYSFWASFQGNLHSSPKARWWRVRKVLYSLLALNDPRIGKSQK